MARTSSLLLAGIVLLPGCAPAPVVSGPAVGGVRYATIVDAGHSGTEGARVEGVPTFRTLGGALAAAPDDGAAPYLILIRNGRYYEKLSVDKPNIHLLGESRDGTVLTYDAAAGHPRPEGGTWSTRGSFTLRITAPSFRLENMTVENGFDYPANAAKAEDDPTKLQGAQAVAVLTAQGNDRAVFTNCRLSGYQDTLFADSGRSYFHRCEILGHVDFIFGAGQVVFDDCDIVSRDRGDALNNGYIAAPSTLKSQPYGFLFLDSRLRKEHPAMAPGSVALGRPWRPSGNPQSAGNAVYVNTWMDDHISAQGWEQMAGFPPEAARLFEYGSSGPGALASPSRRVLTDAEAEYYTLSQVLRGWDPRAGGGR
ncbi:MAG TPA: pectinesterase family protein [Longimicrobiaceae bacterium]|nr:pectinesterase family protein [Longimicrobiaceae bacterium]